jgi:1,4-dihydroxy-2-naphthoyl-CoA hydrolase
MTIWHTKVTLVDLNAWGQATMVQHLGIEYLEIGNDYIRACMPVDHRTVQPARILHGGASVALAETLGSVAAFLCIDPTKKRPVGLDINANHVRPVASGYVEGVARPIHLGRSTHIWEIRIQNEEEKLVCIARLTVAILDLEQASPTLAKRRGETREGARAISQDGVRYLEVDGALRDLVEETWGGKVARHIHLTDGFSLIAFAGEELAGLISVVWRELPQPSAAGEEAFIDIIEVAPKYRRQGIARNLLRRAAARTRDRGAHQFRAWSSEDKVEAIAMWQAIGFALCPAIEYHGGREIRGFYAAKVL